MTSSLTSHYDSLNSILSLHEPIRKSIMLLLEVYAKYMHHTSTYRDELRYMDSHTHAVGFRFSSLKLPAKDRFLPIMTDDE